MNRHQWQRKMDVRAENNAIANQQIQQHYTIATGQLKDMMLPVMEKIANACGVIWNHSEQVNNRLDRGLQQLDSVRKLYCIDINGYQHGRTINRTPSGLKPEPIQHLGTMAILRDIKPGTTFLISRVYYNYTTDRQTISAVHAVKDRSGAMLGYLCAELDMADLMLLISRKYLSNRQRKVSTEQEIPRHLLLQ